ncbi:MAG TPA: phosphoserine phosphatase SerB [Acidisoma sp.]|jgi:phosphoserine phosphatase|uniref:phosphoserine phosphatase SerB n=1 Tax=Acidisoma sp. TaxID=1872115 RepID=UPI002CFBAFA1|nr:phosphoserine phosphatase SerB [Acidisoma sp.]HTI02145.1 phosphoserine phosphatase SerB [Acidisoma sp.]
MRHILTLVADRQSTTLSAAVIRRVQEAVRGGDPVILSEGEAADISVDQPPDPVLMQEVLENAPVDWIVTKSRGRRKGLLVADMDSTIVTSETLDELAGYAGLQAEIAAITTLSMNGEIDFAEALRRRVSMLRGLSLDALRKTWEKTELMPGARELIATMRKHNALTALVSGGFTFFTGKVAEAAGFDRHHANVLLDDGVALTGEVAEPILDRDAKKATLLALAQERGLQLSATMAVGDGANDLAMLAVAGLGIAYHAKPIVAREAKARVDHGNLRALLFAQGYPAATFVS